MLDLNNPEIKKFFTTQKVLWATIGFYQFVLLFLVWEVNKEVGFRFANMIPDFSFEGPAIFPTILSAFGLVMFMLSLFLPTIVAKNARLFAKPNATIPTEFGVSQTALIIGMAFAQAGSIIGFVIAYTAKEPTQILPLLALGLYSHFQKFPTTELVEKLIDLQKKDGPL